MLDAALDTATEATLLAATLALELAATELATPVKFVANFEVALIPLALLIKKLPQVLNDAGFQLLTISKAKQQEPLPLQLQPM